MFLPRLVSTEAEQKIQGRIADFISFHLFKAMTAEVIVNTSIQPLWPEDQGEGEFSSGTWLALLVWGHQVTQGAHRLDGVLHPHIYSWLQDKK